MASISPVSLRWVSGREDLVRISGSGMKVVDVPIKELAGVKFLDKNYLVVRHVDGRKLVSQAAAVVNAKAAKGLIVESSTGRQSMMGPIGFATIGLWTGDAASATRHPAMRVLPYLPNGSIAALVEVIGHLFDPRWYQNPERPDRLSRIEKRIGLVPSSMRNPCAGRKLVDRCWAAVAGTDLSADLSAADFFGRMYAAQVGEGRDPARAMFSVGRYFIKVLYAAWLEGYSTSQGDRMFDAKLLVDKTAFEAVHGPTKI